MGLLHLDPCAKSEGQRACMIPVPSQGPPCKTPTVLAQSCDLHNFVYDLHKELEYLIPRT